MITGLSKYGYPSRAAFLRDRNIPPAKFNAIADDADWSVAKSVLKHVDCPLDIRDSLAASPIWYVRYCAMFSSAAPFGYYHKAKNDPHKLIQNVYKRAVDVDWTQGPIKNATQGMRDKSLAPSV